MNKSEAVYKSKQIHLAFADPEAVNDMNEAHCHMTESEFIREMQEYDEAICECHNMFLNAKDMDDEDEMRFWRQMEQENRTAKRLMREEYCKEAAAA